MCSCLDPQSITCSHILTFGLKLQTDLSAVSFDSYMYQPWSEKQKNYVIVAGLGQTWPCMLIVCSQKFGAAAGFLRLVG